MSKTEPKQELTRAELEIMQILWKRNGAFVGEMIDDMPHPKPAYNTVSTIVRILEKKGVVGYEAFGRSHRYFPLIDKEEYTRGFMHSVMTNFFDSSPVSMFSFFASRENLSVKEMEQIMELARKAIETKKQ